MLAADSTQQLRSAEFVYEIAKIAACHPRRGNSQTLGGLRRPLPFLHCCACRPRHSRFQLADPPRQRRNGHHVGQHRPGNSGQNSPASCSPPRPHRRDHSFESSRHRRIQTEFQPSRRNSEVTWNNSRLARFRFSHAAAPQSPKASNWSHRRRSHRPGPPGSAVQRSRAAHSGRRHGATWQLGA